ncbi:MAG: DNA-processing protein DprA [Lachnospiraceae bacterium]|nr:DNA-processing protein DprA [Lachnospiraceae bacterium]
MEELKYELWLMKLSIGNVAKNKLTDCLSSARAVYEADKSLLMSTNMIDEEVADRIIEDKKDVDLDSLYEEFLSYDQKLITRSMSKYPDKLRTISSAPHGLFYIGHFPDNFDKCVSIVGARTCSEYGRSVATELAANLARRGYVIVSGLALGIDNAAHQGALQVDGVSVAVLGCGVENCYPRGNINTYTALQKKGAIISELYPKTKPMSYNFPTRNRIISALSNQVIIIEAREKSGSLITADFALEQGKDIYALPGRITDSLSGGCNRLIEQGAGIITSVSDFINNIEEVRLDTIYTGNDMDYDNFFKEKEDRIVYECLDFYPKNIEKIVSESNLELMRVLASVMNLCEMGFAGEAFVNQYVKLK